MLFWGYILVYSLILIFYCYYSYISLLFAQLGRHRIFTMCRVYRKLAAKFKVGVLLVCAMLRFTCYYARIMLDAFALLLFLKIFWHNYLQPTFNPFLYSIRVDVTVPIDCQSVVLNLPTITRQWFGNYCNSVCLSP